MPGTMTKKDAPRGNGGFFHHFLSESRQPGHFPKTPGREPAWHHFSRTPVFRLGRKVGIDHDLRLSRAAKGSVNTPDPEMR